MNIKVFWGFIFSIISLSGLAQDFSCDDARRELVSIEAALLNAKLPQCGSEGAIEEPYCCNTSKPNTCKNRRQLEVEYNDAVSDLVIKEGIIAMGLSIESNHNALRRLGPEQAQQIRDYAQELDRSLEKAEFIYEAIQPMTPNGFDFVFSDYNGANFEDFQGYLTSKCETEPFDQSSICLRINRMTQDPNVSGTRVLEMKDALHGFLIADNQRAVSITSGSEINQRYSDYRSQLSVSVQGEVDTSQNIFAAAVPNEAMTPTQYRESEIYQKIQELPGLLSLYEQLLLEGKTAEADELGTQILRISNAIDPIRANFQLPPPFDGEDASHLSRNFGTVMNSISMPDLLLTEPIKKNFDEALEIFTRDKSRLNMGLEFNIKGILADNQGRELSSGQTIGEACNNEFGTECLRTLCPNNRCPEELNASVSASGQPQLNLSDYQEALRSLDIQQGLVDSATAAQACFDPNNNPTTEDKRQCLMEADASLANITTSDLEAARFKVEAYDQLMAIQDVVAPFNDLNIQKALTIEALSSPSCNQLDIVSARIDRGYCERTEEDALAGLQNIDQSFIAISDDIVIKLNNEIVRQGLSTDPTIVAELERGQRVLDSCQPDDERPLCIALRDREAFQAEQEILQAERETRRQSSGRVTGRVSRRSHSNPGFWDGFQDGAVQGLAYGVVPLFGALGERAYVRDTTNGQINRIRAYDEWYMRTLPQRREFFENYPTSISNWGYDFQARNDALTYSNFQTSSQPNLFGNAFAGPTNLGANLSFAPPPIATNSGITFNPSSITGTGGITSSSSTSTNTSTGNTTTSFGF